MPLAVMIINNIFPIKTPKASQGFFLSQIVNFAKSKNFTGAFISTRFINLSQFIPTINKPYRKAAIPVTSIKSLQQQGLQ